MRPRRRERERERERACDLCALGCVFFGVCIFCDLWCLQKSGGGGGGGGGGGACNPSKHAHTGGRGFLTTQGKGSSTQEEKAHDQNVQGVKGWGCCEKKKERFVCKCASARKDGCVVLCVWVVGGGGGGGGRDAPGGGTQRERKNASFASRGGGGTPKQVRVDWVGSSRETKNDRKPTRSRKHAQQRGVGVDQPPVL